MQSIKVKFIEAAKLNSQERYAKDSAGMVRISEAAREKRLDQDSAVGQTEKTIEGTNWST